MKSRSTSPTQNRFVLSGSLESGTVRATTSDPVEVVPPFAPVKRPGTGARFATRPGRLLSGNSKMRRVLHGGVMASLCLVGLVMARVANTDTEASASVPVEAKQPAPAVTVTAPEPEITALPRAQERLVTLDDDRWVYPIAGVDARSQPTPLGTFGARRLGRRPRECGKGHCGVDLHGPRGTPIVAVRAGVISRVHGSRSGKGGRYVRVLHDDGSLTYYMHLDRIHPGLRKGSEVAAGQVVGTLGRTGLRHSSAHLHFAWKPTMGYRDPAEQLAEARVLAEPGSYSE
jgi:murein DD-endopeptidase MepM/ murein hydrolase activator NlpD